MKAIVADPTGGPENLVYMDLPTPEPGEGEALVKLEAIGVNFVDVYYRMGLYKAPESPVRLGNEGAGTIVAVGKGVDLPLGQRVAYAMTRGSYAEYAVAPVKSLVPLPDGVSFDDAAGVILQGLTAHYLAYSTYALKAGETCLVHAAAGGVGLLLVQIAKNLGATVIGTVSTQAKAELVKEHGADEVILYTEQDFVAETKRITGGKGVSVVYDSVGKTTFYNSLDCLKPRGMMALFGQSSGPVGGVDPQILNQKGSLFLTRPGLGNYISEAGELQWRAGSLFQWIAEGKLQLRIHKTYRLEQAAEAHRDLEARRTTGKLLLKP
jgi:NADPH2:quinone reductase